MAYFMKTSVKARLITSFLVILLVPSIIISLISYSNTKEQIAHEQLASAEESLYLLNDNLTAIIEPKLKQANFLSTYVTKNDLHTDVPHVNVLLDEYLAMHTDVDIAYVGTAEGKMVRRPYYEYATDYDPRKRPWYIQATENSGQVIITDPYISTSTGELVVTIAKQLDDKSGVYGIDMSIQTVVDIANSVSIGDTGFVSIIDNANNYISNPHIDSGTSSNEPYVEVLTTKSSSDIFGEHTVLYEQNDLTGWKLYGNMVNKEAQEAARTSLISTAIVVIICFVFGAGLAYFIIRSILQPIRLLTETATQISRGDLTKAVAITNNDEIGKLSHSFEGMRQHLVQLISEVKQSATNVNASSTTLHSNATETANATELASASVQEIAATLDTQMIANEQNVQTMATMEQSITTIANNSHEISALSQEALSNATVGTKSVQRTVNQMQSISHVVTAADDTVRTLSVRIAEIDSIVDVINGIANQTNLLALNASIEAARAGVHGQGFAVVAQEVGKLAESSQASTKQISELITSIQTDTSQSVAYMTSVKDNVSDGLTLTNDTAQQFTLIVNALEQITPMIDYITTNTQELASAAGQATASASELSGQSQQNAAAVEEIAAITEQINHSMKEIGLATDSLQQLSTTLHNEVKRFTT